MTTTGTYGFSPSFAECALQAFRRIGKSRVELTAEHMLDASVEANGMMATWANRGPNLWAVDQLSIPLVSGVATYPIDPATVMVLDAYLSDGASDRIMAPISRTDYAAYPAKTQPGRPTVFWFDRLVAPSITLWPVPNASGITLNAYRFRQTQDMANPGAPAPEMPYRWLDAFIYGLAERLAIIYPPANAAAMQMLSAKAAETYAIAADQDTENAPLRIRSDLSGYWR